SKSRRTTHTSQLGRLHTLRTSQRRELRRHVEGPLMHMSNESLLVIIVVGIVAGWLAGQIVRGAGFGLVGDLILGIVGAFIGAWLLPQLGINLGAGIIRAIINATIGAVVLLLLIRLVRGRPAWGWGSRWR